MNGIDRITASITSDAERDAERIVSEANETAAVIIEDQKKRSESLRRSISARTEKERAEIDERTRSSAALLKRNRMLEAKSEILDSAYERAVQMLLDQSDDDYYKMLTGIFKATVEDQIKAEQTALSHDAYGEYAAPEIYILKLDRDTDRRIGDRFYKSASEFVKKNGKKLERSTDTVEIKGGFVLVCGDVELSCGIPVLMSSVRADTESEVLAKLFG